LVPPREGKIEESGPKVLDGGFPTNPHPLPREIRFSLKPVFTGAFYPPLKATAARQAPTGATPNAWAVFGGRRPVPQINAPIFLRHP